MNSTHSLPRALRLIFTCLAPALALALGVTPGSAAELLTNGSFETGKTVSDGGYVAVALPSADLPGWSGNFTQWYMNHWNGITAQDGTRYVNLCYGTGTDVISQSFTVTAGTEYTVSYYELRRGTGGYMDTTLSVTAGTLTGANGSPVAVAAGPAASIVQTSAANAAWTLHSFKFTPNTATTATITFGNVYGGGRGGDNDGVFLDNVSVTGTASTTIGTTPSTTTLARSSGTVTPSTYGAALGFDVSIAGTSGTPTGTVTLKDGGSGGTTLGSASLTNGTCAITTTTLAVGSHANIVAVYGGDSTYTTSTSSALSAQTVNQATPSVTITGATSFFYNGSAQGPNTATTGGSTGTLSFSYVGSGGTTYPASSTVPTNIGAYTCTATVAADANFLSASSGATAFTIQANPVGGTSADAYLTNTSQIRSASNNPAFGAGLTQNAAAVNLTWYTPLDMAFGADREGAHGKLAGATLNGIAFHDILLGNAADTASGIPVANALAGVTMDYTLTGGINRNFPAAIYTGTDAAVLYNISATNACRDIHSLVTFHGLTPSNNVYVQLIGGNMWKVPVAVSLNGATPVNWTSQAACKDPGAQGEQDGSNNSALLGLSTTTDGSGNLTIDVYSTGGNGYHGLGAITVAQQLVVITGPPAPPTGLAATPAAPGSVALAWNTTVGAAGYKVWCENNVTHAVQNFTTTASPYTVTGLTNGTLYNFKVLGTNSFGDGTYSGVVSATPLASAACDILTCDFPGLGSATISGTSILFTVPPGQSRASLAASFTLSPYANLNPVSGTPRDFTNSVTTPLPYTVTAQNGTTRTYYVTVQSYESWAHAGSLFILTTPDGADIPAGATETHFPLLVRLHSGNFTFSEAQSDGRDIRFTTAAGAALSYQIEEWDSANGSASIWVLIPTITGNARQEIRLYWGKDAVASESNPAAVFNAASGFACVMHLGDALNPLKDDVGNLTPSDSGTTTTAGLIGKARRFADGQGVDCGIKASIYPSGSNPHSSSFWFKTAAAGQLLLWWGFDQPQGKVMVRFDAPPHISVQTWSDGGGVNGASPSPLSQWTHVVHTYRNGEAKVYVNGVLDGTTTGGTPMNIPTTAGMWLGGYPYFGYHYVGDVDELRISKVTRSANWVKCEYENQNPLQTLVGSLVPDGSAFAVTPTTLNMHEGGTVTLTAQAGGAQKTYWIRKQDGVDTVLAVDQLALDYPAGRVAGTQSFVIQFKAVFPTATKTVDIPVTVNEAQPDPVFTLTAPSIWDGRQTITVTPNISNLTAMQAAGAATFNYNWSATGVAVLKQISPGVLTLTRSQGSGPLSVTLVMDNGGVPVTSSTTISIQEPATDAWVQRTPGASEKPVTGQFFARDGTTGMGTIVYNGTQASATAVFLKVYATPEAGTEAQYGTTLRQTLTGSGAYTFTVPISAGLVKYRVEFGTRSGTTDTVTATVSDMVCGDAYIIDGQSNAVAYDYYNQAATYPELGNYSSTWIRTYGQNGESGAPLNGAWAIAKVTVQPCIGVWGMTLARNLMETYGIPICILNGAVGGTRIDQHQANPADHYAAGSRYSIYANLLTRVAAAKLTHGIRGALWHQGEADLSNWGGNLNWDYTYYQQKFLDMSAAWKLDMPNLRYYYLFQVFASGCGASGTFTSDMLRDVQRKLPLLFSGNMSVMPTLAFPSGASCHFTLPDYAQMGLSMAPLVARDIYGLVPTAALNAPNLKQAWFTTASKNEIALEFDQSMQWSASSSVNFYLDRVGGKVVSGSATGKIVKLQLNGTSTNATIDYVVDQFWDSNPANLLYGTNHIAALSFYAVPIAASAPSPFAIWAADPAQGLIAGLNDGPLDDPDHDGMTNFQEFAFGLSPSNGKSVNPLAQPLDRAAGRFQYTRRVGSGLTYQVFTSTTLGVWALDAGATEVALTTSGPVETVTVHVTTAPLNGKLFARVQAQ